jgi:CMP-N,N'-diacetyllegionaminic acid synthase
MKNGKRILAIIPARGNSIDVPNKNLRYINVDGTQKTLLAHTIATAQQSQYIDTIVVCSDDESTRAEAERLKVATLIAPDDISGEKSESNEPIIYTLQSLQKNNDNYDYFILLQVTSPLREAEDIDACLDYYLEQNVAGACTSVTKPKVPAQWIYKVTTDHTFSAPVTEPVPSLIRQNLPETVAFNGAIYIAPPAWYIANKNFINAPSIYYVMPAEKSLDIKAEEDFEILEAFLRIRTAKKAINTDILKQIADQVIIRYLQLSEPMPTGDAREANALWDAMNEVTGNTPESFTMVRKLIIDYLLANTLTSEQVALSIYKKPLPQANSLRSILINTFMGPALGGQKSLQFLQSREKAEDYFDRSLPRIVAGYTSQSTSSNDAKLEASGPSLRAVK